MVFRAEFGGLRGRGSLVCIGLQGCSSEGDTALQGVQQLAAGWRIVEAGGGRRDQMSRGRQKALAQGGAVVLRSRCSLTQPDGTPAASSSLAWKADAVRLGGAVREPTITEVPLLAQKSGGSRK
jgi:hypothetical protein